MEKSYTHRTIDVMSLVILICNEKLLSPCPTKIKMNKRGFSQTWWINWHTLQSPNVPAKPGIIISDRANGRSRLPTILLPQSSNSTPAIKQKWLTLLYFPNSNFIQNGCFILLYPFKVHYLLTETMRYKCVNLYCHKSSSFLVSCLLRSLSIKIISQSSIPLCPSNIKWA